MDVISLESKYDETFPCIFNAKNEQNGNKWLYWNKKITMETVQMNCLSRTIGNVIWITGVNNIASMLYLLELRRELGDLQSERCLRSQNRNQLQSVNQPLCYQSHQWGLEELGGTKEYTEWKQCLQDQQKKINNKLDVWTMRKNISSSCH